MMKCVICATLSAPPRLPSPSASQSGDGTLGDGEKFNKSVRISVPRSPGKWQSLRLLRRQTSRLLLLYFGMKHKREIINAHVEKCTAQFFVFFILRNIATAGDGANLSHYLCIVSSSSNNLLNLNLFKAHFSFAAATEIDLESDNAPPCKLLPSVVDCMGLHLHGGIINPAQLSSYE